MPAPRRALWIARAIAIAAGVVMTAVIVWSFRHHENRAGQPIAAELRGESLALVDYLPGEDRPQRRTTFVALSTGELLSRGFDDDTRTGYFTPPEQFCAATRDLGDRSPLIVPPYAGQIGVTHHAEAPPGKVLVAPHTGALGFLVDAQTRELQFGGDVLYIHMYSFDASLAHGHPQSWLSRIAPDGTVRWSRQLAGGCQLAVLRGNTLVVAMKSAEARAIALDVATGLPRWQFAH